VAGIVAVALVVLYLALREPAPPETKPTGAAGPPATPPAAPPAPAEPTPPVAPAPQTPPSAKLVAATSSVFARNGYLPAGPGLLFRKLTVAVQAGSKPLQFHSYGQDVVALVGEQQFESLGLAASGEGLGPPSIRGPIDLQGGESRELTFLLEMPAGAASGELAIRGVGQIPLPPMPAPPALPADALVGTYVELLPRNLQPLLRDPVMAAIEAVPSQTLTVQRDDEGLHLAIPGAEVTGTATAIGAGTYRAKLSCDQHSLEAFLRLDEGGRTLILYLSVEPFHQMTYLRK